MSARRKIVRALAYDSLGGLATEQDITSAETLLGEYRAEVLAEAADAAYAEGDRLYDEQGFVAAEAAWGLSSLLRRMADPTKAARMQDAADTLAAQRSTAEPDPAAEVDRWNAAHPIGTPVTAYPGLRPEDNSKCVRLITHTRSAASVLGGHTAVVWVEGHGACIKLTHVDPQEARHG
ncbi:hypothetical protein [Streptomyces rubiginosohelvolus]|uniref:hypothetical protein n=1 Tax=Streptomyces rubiginosohelvolus TaxID=67362 RepID=UPI0036886F9B